MFTFAKVDAYAKTLPGVTIGDSWGNKTWVVNERGFAWQRPLSKADIKRYGERELPQGELLAVRVENLDAKDALLSMALPGFFTIEHFNGYPAILIELRLAKAEDVRRAILDAHRTVAAAKPRAKAKPSAKAKAKAKTKTKPKAKKR